MHKCEGCGKNAEWKATFAKIVRGTFGKAQYYCGTCLLEDLNGEHTGGGPTLDCFVKIKRLKQPKVDEIYYGKNRPD